MPDPTYITREEHEEFRRRMDDEEKRQNHRIERLEDTFEKINDLTLSVRELVLSLKAMQTEQLRQGERLDAIEREPGDKWNKAVWLVISMALTAAVTLLIAKLGG